VPHSAVEKNKQRWPLAITKRDKRDRCYWAYARGHNVNFIVKFLT
jgi:hypothetical protein